MLCKKLDLSSKVLLTFRLCFWIVSYEAWYCPKWNKIYYLLKIHTAIIVTNIFHKRLSNICLENSTKLWSILQCPRDFRSFNFNFCFSQYQKKCARDSPIRASFLVLLQKKKDFPVTFWVTSTQIFITWE